MPSLQNVGQDESVKVTDVRCRINIEYGARDIVGLVLEVGPYLRRGMKTDCVLEWASLACPYLGLCQRLTDESTGEP